MTVLSHSCLPLTSNLRLRGSEDKNDGEVDQSNWYNLLIILKDAVAKGKSHEEFAFDYKYVSLWSPRLTLRGRKVNIYKCSPEEFVRILREHTYFYKRLPVSARNRLKKLSKDGTGRRRIKDYLDTVDGVLMSMIFSFPEYFLREPGYQASDRLINSVLTNCISHYSLFNSNLKRARKTVRHAVLNRVPLDLNLGEVRELSFLAAPQKWFKRNTLGTSRERIYRMAMLSQTRACGLGGKKLAQKTLAEFIEKSSKEIKFEPDETMTTSIDSITDWAARQVDVGTNPQFRVSMSTSACREMPSKKEGKFGYLKELVRLHEKTIPTLLSESSSGVIGDWLFANALSRALRKDPELMKVNVATIRENGKVRIVTSGSFWKEALLQPFSHITIQLIKTFPSLKDSLSAGRLGWTFAKDFDNLTDAEQWFFDPKVKKHMYTTDWGCATDGPAQEQGRRVTGELLRKCGVPGDILGAILDVWLGVKSLYYKGKFVGYLRRGIPMGDPLTKTNLCLAHPICDQYAKRQVMSIHKRLPRVVGAGNGDDTIRIVDDVEYTKWFSHGAQMLGYELSPLDECVNPVWGIYSEEYVQIPINKLNTCKWGSRYRESELLPYLDTPKLRVMIATEKDREDFSSDPRGKVSLMGHDQEYFKQGDSTPLTTIFAIASAFQDISLSTVQSKWPMFMPRQVHGQGKPPPFWNVQSYLNILKESPEWIRKYYLTCMYEYNKGRNRITAMRGAINQSKHFKQEAMLEVYEIPQDSEFRSYVRVKKDDRRRFHPGAILKLIHYGYLVPETKVAKYFLMQERLSSLEQDSKRDLFDKVKPMMIKLQDPPEDEREPIVREFVEKYRFSPHLLKGERWEDLYDSKVIEILEEASPLRVNSVSFPLLEKFKFGKKSSRSTYEKRGDQLWNWFKGVEKGYELDASYVPPPPPTEVIEDDPVIIQEVLRSEWPCVLVTDDIRLFRLCRNRTANIVLRMSPRQFLNTMETMSSETSDDEGPLGAIFAGDPLVEYENKVEDFEWKLSTAFARKARAKKPTAMRLFVDSGSVEAYKAKFIGSDDGTQLSYVPWNKDVTRSNMVRTPGSARGHVVKPKTIEEQNFPISLCEKGDWEALLQLAQDPLP